MQNSLNVLILLSFMCQSLLGVTLLKTCPVPNQHCKCANILGGDVSCREVSRIPESLPQLTSSLILTSNYIGPVLLKYEVNHLTNISLHELYLNDNEIQAIEDNAFEMLFKLWLLDLSENDILALSDNTFVGLKNLRYLFLFNTGLMTLSTRLFEQVPQLQLVDLEENKLTAIGQEFSSLRRLSSLLLAGNQIVEISAQAFHNLFPLTHLSLFGNTLSKPQSSWFETIVKNNGSAEVDRRRNSKSAYPNSWICCRDAIHYYLFLSNLSKTLQSYYDLDLVCSWPMVLSGRLMSSLNVEELNTSSCDAFSTTSSAADISEAELSTSSSSVVHVVVTTTFHGGFNYVAAFLILLLACVFAAMLVAIPCYLKQSKESLTAVQEFVMSMKYELNGFSNQSEKQPTVSTRPYRQQKLAYGATMDITERSHRKEPNRKINVSTQMYRTPFAKSEIDFSEDEMYAADNKAYSTQFRSYTS